MSNAKHTCGGPSFGRKTPGCPRCDELLAGVPTRQLSDRRARAQRYNGASKGDHKHDCVASNCGPVCTRGDW